MEIVIWGFQPMVWIVSYHRNRSLSLCATFLQKQCTYSDTWWLHLPRDLLRPWWALHPLPIIIPKRNLRESGSFRVVRRWTRYLQGKTKYRSKRSDTSKTIQARHENVHNLVDGVHWKTRTDRESQLYKHVRQKKTSLLIWERIEAKIRAICATSCLKNR